VRLDATFRLEKSPVGLEYRHEIVRQLVGGKALPDLIRRQHFVWQSMHGARLLRAFEDAASRQPAVDRAGHVKQSLARGGLELTPEGKGALEEGDVRRVFEVREPDDPRESVGRSSIVAGFVSIDGDDGHSPTGEVERRGASHAPNSKHYNVMSASQLPSGSGAVGPRDAREVITSPGRRGPMVPQSRA
jgi:hypothetical protein